MAQMTIDDVIEVAFAVEEGDPIEWYMFAQGKEQAMRMIAASVLEQFGRPEYTDADLLIMVSTIAKLVTENMILNAKIMAYERKPTNDEV